MKRLHINRLSICLQKFLRFRKYSTVTFGFDPSGVTAVTPIDRPKSVRNSCVIKVLGGVFMLSRRFLD